MIIVKLMGGLGNQLFQYAFGKSLAEKHGTELKFDLEFLLDRRPNDNPHFVFRDYDLSIFNIAVPTATPAEIRALKDRTGSAFANKVLDKLLGPKKSFIREQHFHVSPEFLELPDNVYLEGYWQSEHYFAPIAEKLRTNDFQFRQPLAPEAAALLETIRSTNAVCVNVRRGDFVSNPVHGTMGTDYYTAGEQLLNERYADLHYFVFSDDVEWCEANLRFERPVTFVSHAYAGEKFQDYLRLMAACQHFLIPNSSFAWWAAWFCDTPEKTVIAPQRWFGDAYTDTTDLIPATWIRL